MTIFSGLNGKNMSRKAVWRIQIFYADPDPTFQADADPDSKFC